MGLGIGIGISPILREGVGVAGFTAYGPLTRWRAAKARVAGGTGRGRIVCPGDSTTAGVGAQDITGRRKEAYPFRLAAKLAGLGIAASGQSFIGTQNTAIGSTTTFDPRLVAGAGWAADNALEVPGGRPFRNTADTTALSFTPDNAFDTAEIYSLANTGLGTYSWDVDGGSATNVSTNTAAALKRDVATVALGTHTLNLKRVSGSCYINGAICYDSSVKAVDVINAGRGSATTDTLVSDSQPFYPFRGFPTLAADLYIIDIGINDWNASSPIAVATYKSQLASFAAACFAVGDVILRVPAPSDTSWQTTVNQNLYRTAIYEVAQAGGYVVADMFTRWTSRAVSVDKYFDVVHPNSLGYQDEADMLGPYLAAA